MATSDPNPPVNEKDTEGVTGQPGPASTGTASTASDVNTEGPQGGERAVDPAAPAATNVDTEGAQGGPANATQTDTSIKVTLDTTHPGAGGTPEANPPYRAPSGPVPASTRDTTLTDKQPGGSATDPVPTSTNMTGTQETINIGAAGTGTGTSAPAAPTSVTAVAGPRQATVSWAAPANPSGDPVLGYVILASTGGTAFVGKNVTSATVTDLQDSVPYTFQVAARNKAGIGAYSAPSNAVTAYNPDAPDKAKPAGIADANRVNPVYRPDGSIKPGTGGTNNAPGSVTATAGAAGSKQVTVHWSAPTIGGAPTGYSVAASNGTTATAAAGATSAVVTFAASGASVTFTVTATNAVGTGETSAPTAAVTVP